MVFKQTGLICVEKTSIGIANKEDLECIYVGAFNDTMVEEFHESFQRLNSDADVKIIPIVINSFGGQLHSLLAVLDIMSSTTKPICTVAVGKAMSCGVFLLAAGTPGYRFAGLNADIMIHEVSGGAVGKTAEVVEEVANLTKLNAKVLKMFAKWCGKEPKFFINKLKTRSQFDWFLSAAQAKSLGIIDSVGVPSFLKK